MQAYVIFIIIVLLQEIYMYSALAYMTLNVIKIDYYYISYENNAQ